MATTLEQEILKISGAKPQRRTEDDQAYYMRILKAMETVEDADYFPKLVRHGSRRSCRCEGRSRLR